MSLSFHRFESSRHCLFIRDSLGKSGLYVKENGNNMWLVVVPIYHGYMSNLCTESLQFPCVNLTSYYCSDSTINLPSNKVITGGEIQAFSADST